MAQRLLNAAFMKHVVAPLLGAALVVSACAETQLGQSQFTAPCPAGDEGCDDDAVKAPIAVGGRLALEVRQDLAGAFAVPVRLEPVNGDVIAVDDEGALVGVAPGLSAVMLLAGDVVIDVVHVSVLKATRLSLHRGGGAEVDGRALPDRIQLFAGEELTISARAWHDSQQLGGDLVDSWSSSNPAFLLADQGFAHERRLRAPDAGSTELTVALPTGASTSVTLEVLP